MKKLPVLCFLLSMLFTTNVINGQSRIGQSKSEIKSGSSGSSSNNNSSSSSSGNSSSDSDISDLSGEDSSLGGAILFGAIRGIFIATYYVTLGDLEEEEQLKNQLTPYPLYDSHCGNYQPYDSLKNYKKFRVDFNEQLMFLESNIYANRFDATLRPYSYFYLHTGYTHLSEYVETQDRYNHLALLRFDVGYDRVKLQRFNLGWSIGATYIPNDINMGGFAFGLQADVYLTHNLSLHASAKWSAVNHTVINEYLIQSRYHINRAYLSAGFDHYQIGKPTFDFVTLGLGVSF
jgi:hypothetical protein